MVTMLVWSFARTLPVALAVRAVQGLGNGNVGILRTTVAELCPWKELQPRAFSIMPLVFTVGAIFGPVGLFISIAFSPTCPLKVTDCETRSWVDPRRPSLQPTARRPFLSPGSERPFPREVSVRTTESGRGMLLSGGHRRWLAFLKGGRNARSSRFEREYTMLLTRLMSYRPLLTSCRNPSSHASTNPTWAYG